MASDPFWFMTPKVSRRAPKKRPDFDQFEAMELYCPECSQAVPVRKSLLLVLPEGDKYEYRCQYCGTTVGNKIDRAAEFQGIIKS
jgi:hypothetical protein